MSGAQGDDGEVQEQMENFKFRGYEMRGNWHKKNDVFVKECMSFVNFEINIFKKY